MIVHCCPLAFSGWVLGGALCEWCLGPYVWRGVEDERCSLSEDGDHWSCGRRHSPPIGLNSCALLLLFLQLWWNQTQVPVLAGIIITALSTVLGWIVRVSCPGDGGWVVNCTSLHPQINDLFYFLQGFLFEGCPELLHAPCWGINSSD